MKIGVPIFLLVAIGHAAELKVPSRSNQNEETEEYETAKRDLIEGNFGLRTTAPFLNTDVQSINAGIEYADSKQELSDKSPIQQLYATPVPRIAKISDVLTGQGPPFHAAINSHLYSPVSIYQPRLGSPTTYEVSQPIASKIAYTDHQESLFPDQYKQIPQSVQTPKQQSFQSFELPKQSKFFTGTSGQPSFNPFEISKPSFTSLESSKHYFPHFGSPKQSFPSYESSGQFLPIFKTTGHDSFPGLKTSGNPNISKPVTSAQSTGSRSKTSQQIGFTSLEAPRQPIFPHIEYPQGLFEAGFSPHQFYQLINQLENQPELYTEAKTAQYPGPGEVAAPVDYLQAPSPGITYAEQEPREQNVQQGQHEVKTAPAAVTKESKVQTLAPKQNTHPNGAVSYASFSQRLPEPYYALYQPVLPQYQEQPQPQQQKVTQLQLKSTPQPLLQSTPLERQQAPSQSTVEINPKPTTLLPQYLTTLQQPTSPNQDEVLINLPQATLTTQKEKDLTTPQPQLPTEKPEILTTGELQPLSTQRPQILTTLESQPSSTRQSHIPSESPEESLSTLQPQPQATPSLTTLLPHSLSTAQPPLQPESSSGIHPLPYQFNSLYPPQKVNQFSQQSNQAPQQLYEQSQQSNQVPQQSYEQSQHSYQAPQQLYRAPEQSYHEPQQSYQQTQQPQSNQQSQQSYQQPQLQQQQYLQTKPQPQQQSQSFGKLDSHETISPHQEFYSGDTVLTPLLQDPIYSGGEELLPEPKFHGPIVVPPPTIQYFGKFAESIFGGVH